MSAPLLKAVIWDLDDTLWSGILAEGDVLTPSDVAVALVRRLDRAGVVQSVASKNDYDDGLRALRDLDLIDCFVYPQITWSPKSETVDRVIRLLDVGSESVVLIDDSPFERAEVAMALPDVRCLSLEDFIKIDREEGLVPGQISAETTDRPRRYRNEARRRDAEAGFSGSPAEFLVTLDMVLTLHDLRPDDLARASELTDRTHQLNTTGRTFSVDELHAYATTPGHRVLIAELEDRFGDYGRIGLCAMQRDEMRWMIDLFLLSCRVMSRNVGTAMLGLVGGLAEADGLPLHAMYRPNGRNRQMKITYALMGFDRLGSVGDAVVYGHSHPGGLAVPSYFATTSLE